MPIKRNQKDLHKEIATAFDEPVFSLAQWQEQPQPGHGRVDQRNRQHVRAGNITKSETETTYLISSPETGTPEAISAP